MEILANVISTLINLLMYLQKPMKLQSQLRTSAWRRRHCQEQKVRKDNLSRFFPSFFYVRFNNLGFRKPSQKREKSGKKFSNTMKQGHFSQNDTSRISSFANQIMESLSPSKKNNVAKDDKAKFEKERQEKAEWVWQLIFQAWSYVYTLTNTRFCFFCILRKLKSDRFNDRTRAVFTCFS